MKSIFVLLMAALSSQGSTAQQKVGSGSYDVFLKLLLNQQAKAITVKDAATKKNNLFIDARERNEYDVSHIKNAVFGGYKDFNKSLLVKVPKNREIIVYCSVGKRSEKVSQQLTKAGYTNVWNLYGGIFEWVNQGNLVVDNLNKNTKKVHVYGRFWGSWLQKGEKVYD